MREKIAVFKGKPTKNHGCYFQIPSARETYCKMQHGWPTAKWLQSLVEHWRNLPPLSTSILEWISQEISDAASAEYQVELAADAMEDESLPKKNLVKHGESWWKDVKAAVLGKAMLWNGDPHSSMSSWLRWDMMRSMQFIRCAPPLAGVWLGVQKWGPAARNGRPWVLPLSVLAERHSSQEWFQKNTHGAAWSH